jgi:type IV pilus assembly protein PilN
LPAKISITGYAQSNARVSSLMAALDDTPLLESSKLIETKSEVVANRRMNSFSIETSITRQTADESAGKTAGVAKAKK